MTSSAIRNTVIVLFLILSLSILADTSQAQEAGPLITLLRGNVYEVVVDRSPVHLRVPVELAPGMMAQDLAVDVLDVSLGSSRLDGLATAFDATLEASGSGRSATLVIMITTGLPLEQGTYNVLLLVRQVKPGTTETLTAERHEIKIILPAAAIRPLSTLVVRREWPWYIFGEPRIAGSPLFLYETTGRSFLSPVTIIHIDTATAEGLPVSGRLVADPVQAQIPAGQQVQIDYKLLGEFPLGKVTENLELSAPQLSAPVPFKVEVSTRMHWVMIPVTLLLGWLTGYLLRIFLEREIQQNTVRLQAFNLLARIESERLGREDPDFREAARILWQDLNAVIEGKDAEAIKNQIDTASQGLTEALNRFQARLVTTQSQINEIKDLLSPQRWLPQDMMEAIQSSRKTLEDAQNQLIFDKNVGAAIEKTNDTKEQLSKTLANLAENFRNELLRWMAGLHGLPAGSKTALSKAKVAAGAINPQNPDLSDLLNDTQTARIETVTLVKELALELREVYEEVEELISFVPNASSLEAIKEKLSELEKTAYDNHTQLEERLSEIQLQFDELRTTWERELTQKVTDEAKKEEILNKLKDGKYVEAARVAFMQPTPPSGTDPSYALRKRYPDGAILAAASARRYMPSQPSRAQPTSTTTNNVFYISETTQQLTARRVESSQRIAAAKLVQTLLAGLLIMLLGYAFFVNNFIGTLTDLLGIFFWAFALDISVSTLVNLGGKFSAK